MKHITKIIAINFLSTLSLQAENILTQGSLDGDIRSLFAGYDYTYNSNNNAYATGLGARLHYKLAPFHGLSAGAELTTAHTLSFLSGKQGTAKFNDELASADGAYTKFSQAYIHYKYDAFNIKAGRQQVDTFLADSDDIRMVPNTFMGVVADYETGALYFTVGHLRTWQGVDAGLDNQWTDTGENGTNFMSLSYHDFIEYNLAYYNVTRQLNALYADASSLLYEYHDITLHGGIQYLHEKELSKSGLDTDIYGAFTELNLADISLSLAYNHGICNQDTQSFSGFGGGTLYTSMDTSILDDILDDRTASAFVTTLGYAFGDNLFLSYAYGNFNGKKNSHDMKKHVVEQDLALEYNLNDDITLSAIYVDKRDKLDKKSMENNWKRTQTNLLYSF